MTTSLLEETLRRARLALAAAKKTSKGLHGRALEDRALELMEFSDDELRKMADGDAE